MGVVLNFKGVGKITPEGRFEVVFEKATGKKNQNSDDVITLCAAIHDDDAPEELDGKKLFRSFTIKSADDADNSGVMFYLHQAIGAFGADLEELDDAGSIDVISWINDQLKGQKAFAKITHAPDRNDANKTFAQVEFEPMGF